MVGKKPDPELLREVLEIIEPIRDINWMEGLAENNDPGSIETRGKGPFESEQGAP